MGEYDTKNEGKFFMGGIQCEYISKDTIRGVIPKGVTWLILGHTMETEIVIKTIILAPPVVKIH